MTDTMAAARDRACLALRRCGATAVVVLTLDDAGTLRLAASHDENLDGSTIYQMILSIGREFEREIAIQLPALSSAAMH